jgi:hypothetical protein
MLGRALLLSARSLVIVASGALFGCAEAIEIDQDRPYEPAFEHSGTEVERCDFEPIAEVGLVYFVTFEDRAFIGVGYGGGCAPHHFKLCWDGMFGNRDGFAASTLRIVHENHQDRCEAGISEPLEFDCAQ